jgi:hypothetical protein
MSDRFVITAEDTERLCGFLREGAYLEPACRLAGVAPGTAREWLARARNAHHRSPTPETIAFADAVEAASAEAEHGALRVVLSGGRGWSARAWYLERRHPGRWAQRRVLRAEEERLGTEILAMITRTLDDEDLDLSPDQRMAALQLLRAELEAAQEAQDVDGPRL